MSHIATALAKMKGRKVEAQSEASLHAIPDIRAGQPPNPFIPPREESAAPSAAVAASANARRRWLLPAIGAGVLLVVASGLWFFLGRKTPPVAVPKPASAARPLPPPKAAVPVAIAPARTDAQSDALAAAPVEPSPVFAEKVRMLVLGAVMVGENPRVLIGGKRFAPGDTIVEGLVLQRVLPGLLVFQDASGAIYTRRF